MAGVLTSYVFVGEFRGKSYQVIAQGPDNGPFGYVVELKGKTLRSEAGQSWPTLEATLEAGHRAARVVLAG